MFPPRPTQLAWTLLRDVVQAGDVVIDATTGNGHDTLFLAGLVGKHGRVIAFDVQQAAIVSATGRLAAAGLSSHVEFCHASHASMAEHAQPGSVTAVMFNLGYLPGEDHQLTTEAAETLAALAAAARVLKPGGVISVVCYPGHQTGEGEAAAVEDWMLKRAAEGWRIAKYAMLGTQRPAPFLLMASPAGK
jgi:ubiquinone/menaquinone biosynthesis C-methylase UbiE